MTPKEQLEAWLGDGWVVDTRNVAQTHWNDRAWRAEYLSQQAQLGLFHLHDGQEEEGSTERMVFFGINVA